MDADSAALAAIHGLNQKLEQTVKEKDAEIQALKKGRLKASDRRRQRWWSAFIATKLD